MPIKETTNSFELRPSGFIQAFSIFGALFVVGTVVVILGFYERNLNRMGYIYFIIVGGLFILGGVIYLIVRLRKIFIGALDIITFDIEGVRVHNRKKGLIQSMTWNEKPRVTIQEDDEYQPEYIILQTDDKEKVIQIPLSEYENFILKGHIIVKRTKEAVASFKQKYRKSIKE
ncbi:MAG: hypothetical protein FK734_14305 [Asgard group archaeon]|nr:hypothetical protein [Asgard group archaeon]